MSKASENFLRREHQRIFGDDGIYCSCGCSEADHETNRCKHKCAPERIFADVPVGKDWVEDATEAGHQRLKDAVVAAAKVYRVAVKVHGEYANEVVKRPANQDDDDDPIWDAQLGAQCSAEYALSKVVDDLIKFERENNL